jgi:outer membrane protein assembly factor BamB
MKTRMGFGEGSTPALHGGTVIVNWDDETDNDFIIALDKESGKQIWKTARHEDTGWSTPLIVQHGGGLQVIVNATAKLRSYDVQTGKEIWSCPGQTVNAIPSPVADADMVYCTSGFRGAAFYAINLSASGEVAGTDAVRWTHNKATPYVPSPLLAGDLIYFLSGNNGILTCLNTKTGAANYEQERLENIREVYASPVAARDRVYVLSRDGTCVVLRKGPRLEILATNKLEEKTDASMALAGKELFVRGKQSLYCITQ